MSTTKTSTPLNLTDDFRSLERKSRTYQTITTVMVTSIATAIALSLLGLLLLVGAASAALLGEETVVAGLWTAALILLGGAGAAAFGFIITSAVLYDMDAILQEKSMEAYAQKTE